MSHRIAECQIVTHFSLNDAPLPLPDAAGRYPRAGQKTTEKEEFTYL